MGVQTSRRDDYVIRLKDGGNTLSTMNPSSSRVKPSDRRKGSIDVKRVVDGDTGVEKKEPNSPYSSPNQFSKKEVLSNSINRPSSIGSTPSPLQRSSSKRMGRSISEIGKSDRMFASFSSQQISTHKKFSWLAKKGKFGKLSISQLDCGRIIGLGLMGVVRIASIKDRHIYFALKSVSKSYIQRHNDVRHIENEKQIMNELNNPFCINLFGTLQDNHNIYFVMELAIGGELFRRLSKKDSFSAQTTKFYVTEIFHALEHVQSLGYIYRDLKPENVMLDEEGHCKLVDFGFSTKPDANGIVRTFCGTPAYLSPEQLNGKFTNGYSNIVDWWSLGILIYELMTGLTPFCSHPTETAYEIYLRILKVKIKFPRQFDSTSRDLVQRLCHADVDKRLCNADSIREHSYFTVPWDAVETKRMVPPFVPRIKDQSDKDHYFNTYDESMSSSSNEVGSHFDGF